MSALVEEVMPLVSPAAIANGVALRGRDWLAYARAANVVLGRGAILVPTCAPAKTIPVGLTSTFRFWVAPRHNALYRIWFVHMSTSLPSGEVTLTSDGDSISAFLSDDVLAFLAPVSARSNAEQEIALEVDASGAAAITVHAITCVELPRAVIAADANEYGIDLDSVRGGAAIYESPGASLALSDSVARAMTETRRPGLLQWSSGDQDPLTSTTTSLVDLFALPPVILARPRGAADTSATVRVAAFCRMSDPSASGEIVVTMLSGDTLTLPVSGTAWAWLMGDVDVDTEDLGAVDGRRSLAWDEAQIQYRVVSGGGKIEIQSVSIGEHE